MSSTNNPQTGPNETRPTKSSISTPRYLSAPPSRSGSAIVVSNATIPSRPGTKSGISHLLFEELHYLYLCLKHSTWWNRDMSDSTQWFESLRVSYEQGELNESDITHNPLDQFNNWLQEAIKNQVPEPNAMVLATVNKDGQPGARNVLLKSADDNGFIFFTNKNSDKASDLKQNPHCTLLFSWLSQHRQVIVKGKAEEISREESNTYFQTRPYGSRISAWVSEQSQVIKSREELETKVKEFMDKYPENVPMPDYWGGYLVKPESIEFWQGRPSRLHDRIRFTKKGNTWAIERISP